MYIYIYIHVCMYVYIYIYITINKSLFSACLRWRRPIQVCTQHVMGHHWLFLTTDYNSYEEFTRLAETRLAQNRLTYI